MSKAARMTSVITKRVILDMDKCVECRSCGAACFYGHKNMPIINYVDADKVRVPIICRQCKKPACVDSCPNEAMVQNETTVSHRLPTKCTGCLSCVRGCPFGVLTDEQVRHAVPKCDLCEGRVLAGGVPRCVETCPSGALSFGEVADVEREGLLLLSSRTTGHHPLKRR
jgi:Fe-S-cluster-containing dehydrogenase component